MQRTATLKARYLPEGEYIIDTSKKYHDGSTVIRILNLEGRLEATATICLAAFGITAPEGQVWIKTWSENEGILQTLVAAKVVEPTLKHFTANDWGSVADLCKLLPEE